MSTTIQSGITPEGVQQQQVARDTNGFWYVVYKHGSTIKITKSTTNADVPIGWDTSITLVGFGGLILTGVTPTDNVILYSSKTGGFPGLSLAFSTTNNKIYYIHCQEVGGTCTIGTANQWDKDPAHSGFGGSPQIVAEISGSVTPNHLTLAMAITKSTGGNHQVHVLYEVSDFGTTKIQSRSTNNNGNWIVANTVISSGLGGSISGIKSRELEAGFITIALSNAGNLLIGKGVYSDSGIITLTSMNDVGGGAIPQARSIMTNLIINDAPLEKNFDIGMTSSTGWLVAQHPGGFDIAQLSYWSWSFGGLPSIKNTITTITYGGTDNAICAFQNNSNVAQCYAFNPATTKLALVNLVGDTKNEQIGSSQDSMIGVMTSQKDYPQETILLFGYHSVGGNFDADDVVGVTLPTVTNVVPSTGRIDIEHTGVVVTGTEFVDVTDVDLVGSTTIPITSFVVDGPTQITMTIPPGVPPGLYEVIITIPAGSNSSSIIDWTASGGYTSVLTNKTFLGNWLTEGEVLQYIRNNDWDSNQDGTGDPVASMEFFDVTVGAKKTYNETSWEIVPEHNTSHQNGGSDEISVSGLSGLLGDAQTPIAHNLGGVEHNTDSLANLNTKVSDATLDDASDPRTPSTHNLGGAEHNVDTLANLNTKVSDATLDDSSNPRTPSAHNLGGSEHNIDTLANLNSKISDATLDDASDPRTPTSHAPSHENAGGDEINIGGLSGVLNDNQPSIAHPIGGSKHTSDTLINLNTKLVDAILDDQNDTRPPLGHDLGGTAHVTDSLANLNTKISDLIAGVGGIRDIGIGTLVQRPAFGTAGRLYHATDTQQLYRDSGSAWVDVQTTPIIHNPSHENGGGDEISVAGLFGVLADSQLAAAHANSHLLAGSDEIQLASLTTDETGVLKILQPDGINGVQWRDVDFSEMYISTPASTIISGVNTPTKILGITTAGELSSSFIHTPSNKLTYIGIITKKFHITIALSGNHDGTPGAKKDYIFSFAKNGTVVIKTKMIRTFDGSTDFGVIMVSGIVQLVTNDFIESFVENITDAIDFTVENMTVVISQI